MFKRKSPNWVVDQGVTDSGSVAVWDWLEFLQYVRRLKRCWACRRPLTMQGPRSLGRALAGLRRFVQADDEYGKALRIAPDSVEIQRETHRNRGYVFAAAGDFHKSAEEFGQACALDPTDSDLWRFYAAAMVASGDVTHIGRCAATCSINLAIPRIAVRPTT